MAKPKHKFLGVSDFLKLLSGENPAEELARQEAEEATPKAKPEKKPRTPKEPKPRKTRAERKAEQSTPIVGATTVVSRVARPIVPQTMRVPQEWGDIKAKGPFPAPHEIVMHGMQQASWRDTYFVYLKDSFGLSHPANYCQIVYAHPDVDPRAPLHIVPLNEVQRVVKWKEVK